MPDEYYKKMDDLAKLWSPEDTEKCQQAIRDRGNEKKTMEFDSSTVSGACHLLHCYRDAAFKFISNGRERLICAKHASLARAMGETLQPFTKKPSA